jgi:hypothetical protein
MQKPEEADLVTELTYGIAMAFHLAVGMVGYLMYGRNASDEVRHAVPVACSHHTVP